MIRILLADDHAVITHGLRQMLQHVPDIQVCGEVNNGQEVIDALSVSSADVVLMDIEMPVMDGIRCTEWLRTRFPSVKVVAISMYEDYPHIQSMIKAGAQGYLLKNCSRQELEDCIRKVHSGGNYFSGELTETLMAAMQGKLKRKDNSNKATPRLSRREKEILKLILEEATTPEIAEKLFISIGTVENHRHNMMNKLGVRNTAGLVRMALTYGLV